MSPDATQPQYNGQDPAPPAAQSPSQSQQQHQHQPQPQPQAQPASAGPRAVRTGTIVWGALVLVACAFVAQQSIAPGTLDTATWVTAVVLGLGVLLLAAGIAAVVKQTRRGR